MEIQNLLTQTFRSLRRQKGFAALNFLGLSVALTVSLLTGLMIFHERSFDNFHTEGAQIFRVVTHFEEPSSGSSEDMAQPAVVLPSIAKAELGELGQWADVSILDKTVVRISPERFFEEKDLLFADTAFFDIFNFDTKDNKPRSVFAQPNKILLTETTAAKYFPKENAIGRLLTIEDGQSPSKEFEIVGIVADAPANSHLPFTMLISANSRKPDPNANWGWFLGGQYLYLKTNPKISPDQVGERLTSMANERKGKDDPSRYTYRLQPLADIHSNMAYAGGNAAYTVDFEQFYWLGAVALFLLLIAAVNYVNLTTAIALRKSREVGVRKTLGASRWDLARRFWFETLFLVVAAMLAAAIAAHELLPTLNHFLGRNMVANWFSTEILGFMAGLCVLTTLAAGFYPAFVMAGFSPVQAFRGKRSAKGTATSLALRRGLIIFQFIVAQVFIVAVIVAATQMHFIRSKPLGFRTDGVLNLRLSDAKPEQISAFRTELARIPGVLSTSHCIGAPTSHSGFTTRFNLPERFEQQKKELVVKVADPQYLETYGLGLRAGRFLTEADMAQAAESVPEKDRKYVCVLNETACKNLGFASPEAALGKTVKTGTNNMVPTIVGVVADFHTRSLRESMQSVAILPFNNFKFALGIRLEPAAANAVTLSKIEATWKTIFPADLFTAAFFDDFLATLYRSESRLFSMFKTIALLALLINALGLIGLTVFVVEAKTKEIGIRKVLGASIAGITGLLAKDFLKLVFVAIVIASPIAWYFMQRWLSDFAYRIDIQWWMFAAAGAAAVLIAFLTVGSQSVKAALANPVKSLRSE
jgi:putative ABC transport system permease protein